MAYSTDADFLDRLLTRLAPLAPASELLRPPHSDFDLNPQFRAEAARTLKPAAVLAPVVRRAEGLSILLTQRTADMPTHAGQVAFPGGRIQAEDAGPVAAALRETEEETGIAPRFVEPIGAFGAYETVTGYAVTPIVGLVDPGFTLKPDPREVAAVFEAPVSFLMNPDNHQRHTRAWAGGERAFYVMPYQDWYIWGATAGMLRALYLKLYA